MDDKVRSVPGPGDGLVIIDVQRDFLPGGALVVPNADEIVPILNRYVDRFAGRSLPVFVTRDWHPANHCSFRSKGGRWPAHCLQASPGAEFAAGLTLPGNVSIISKGTTSQADGSGFSGTGFDAALRAAGVRCLWIGGLATEYCVLATARDALARGFCVILLTDAIRSLDINPGDGARAVQEMIRLGAVPLRREDIA